MSKYQSVEAQSKFICQRVNNIANLAHDQNDDKGRLVYDRTTERLFKGEGTAWVQISTPYDILEQGTQVLFGSYPLPDGWNIVEDSNVNDRIILLTDTETSIGASGGSWTINSINTGGNHRHSSSVPSWINRNIGKSEFYGNASSETHRHNTNYDGTHQHGFDGAWRPPAIKYCIAEYQ